MSVDQRGGMAAGRQAAIEAHLRSFTVQLAAIAKAVGAELLNSSDLDQTVIAYRTRNNGVLARMVSLAETIESFANVAPSLQSKVGRVYLGDLLCGGIYVSHLHEHSDVPVDEMWSYVGPGAQRGEVIADKDGERVVLSGPDHGLCPFGVVTGTWHPYAWVEYTGETVVDGKRVAQMVDAETSEVDVEEEGWDVSRG